MTGAGVALVMVKMAERSPGTKAGVLVAGGRWVSVGRAYRARFCCGPPAHCRSLARALFQSRGRRPTVLQGGTFSCCTLAVMWFCCPNQGLYVLIATATASLASLWMTASSSIFTLQQTTVFSQVGPGGSPISARNMRCYWLGWDGEACRPILSTTISPKVS